MIQNSCKLAALSALIVASSTITSDARACEESSSVSVAQELNFAATLVADAKDPVKAATPHPAGVQLVTIAPGVGIYGNMTRNYVDTEGRTVYVAFDNQAVRLVNIDAAGAISDIKGQGATQHPSGFSTPIGIPEGMSKPLEQHTAAELEALGIVEGKVVELKYPSGVLVVGEVQKIQVGLDARVQVIRFKNETTKITYGVHTLYRPKWGVFDLLAGAAVIDVKRLQD